MITNPHKLKAGPELAAVPGSLNQWADGYREAMRKIEYWKGCHEGRGKSMGMNSYIECQVRDLSELLSSMRRDLEYRLSANAAAERQPGTET